jgi:two-component system nitrate/nitrite response regulator NarL
MFGRFSGELHHSVDVAVPRLIYAMSTAFSSGTTRLSNDQTVTIVVRQGSTSNCEFRTENRPSFRVLGAAAMNQVSKADSLSHTADTRSINVVVLSDVRFVRDALVALLDRSGKTKVVKAVGELDFEFEQAMALRPDIALIDTGLPDGLAAVRYTRQLAPQVRIVALALAEREEHVILWAEAGISSYIPRSAALQDLVHLLERSMRDEQACSPHIANRLMRRIASGFAPLRATEQATLTHREMEIVRLVSEGMSNKEIANRLKIGLATTKSHVHNALGKLGMVRRSQAAQWMHQRAMTMNARTELKGAADSVQSTTHRLV